MKLADVASPRHIKALNGWLTVAWIVLVPVTFVLGWEDSVAWVVVISLWANIASHAAAWVAGRVEVAADEA